MKHLIFFSLIIVLTGCSNKTSSQQDDSSSQHPDSTALAQDIGWPRQISDSITTLVYYQPQIDKWDNYKKLEGRLAFSMVQKDNAQVLGVASFECDTKTDKESRSTYLHNITYTDVRFPSLSDDSTALMKKVFLDLMPSGSENISTDRILAYIDNKDEANTTAVQVKNDPPHIFYSASPAILLFVDGDPVLAPIEKNDLQFIVNTNWDLFFDKQGNQYYLLADNAWLSSQTLQGPWAQATSLPKSFSSLPKEESFEEIAQMIPPPQGVNAPTVFFTDTPAELVLTDGAPVYGKIPGTQLLYISNTENDIFIDQSNNKYYILLSGRWFSGPKFGGPWTYAGNSLPKDFAHIPEDSPKAHVLASVPGTVEASDAVLLAQIPTTVVVNKAEAEAQAKATYDGDPQFSSIEGTSMQYATNTQDKVIRVGDLYYMCFQAVWFVSSSPSGPWKTADSVPAEIYTIPPSSPVYNVTYVTQTNSTSTTVESSSTSGYFGAFIIGATVGAFINAAIVYGTGWYYHPYVYWPPRAMYPIYRPWPCTYGGGAVYNPWTGGWATGRRAYGPYGSAGTAAWYNPATGRYGRSASVQGWYGGRTAANTYNPWTGAYGHTSQGHNPYAQWGHSTVTNGYRWAQSSHVTTANGTAFAYHTSGGKNGVVVNGRNGINIHNNNGNKVYAGPDGNVYRKNESGSWSKYDNHQKTWQEDKLGGKEKVNPDATRNNLNKTSEKKPAIQHKPEVTTRTEPAKQAPQNLSGETHKTPSRDMQRDLNRSDQARTRGDSQVQRFQNHQQGGEHTSRPLRGRR